MQTFYRTNRLLRRDVSRNSTGFCVSLKGQNLFKSFWLDNTGFLDRDTTKQEVVSAIKLNVLFRVAGLAAILHEMYERNIQRVATFFTLRFIPQMTL